MGHEQLSGHGPGSTPAQGWDWRCLGGAAYNHPAICEISTNGHLRSYGGREASLEAKAKTEANQMAQDGKSIAGDAKAGAENILGDVKQKAGELKQKVGK